MPKIFRGAPKVGFRAFSLLEVIVALGIFAGGVLTLLALFPLATKSAEAAVDAEAAAHMADALLAQLRSRGMDATIPLLQTPAELTASDEDPTLVAAGSIFFGSRNLQRLGLAADPLWSGHEAEKFFEIELIRNLEFSPGTLDGERGWLAFTLRVRWPVFRLGAGGESAGIAGGLRPTDPGQRQMLFVSGSVRR